MFQASQNHQNIDIVVLRNHAIWHQLSQDLQKYRWRAPRALGKDAKQAAKQPAWCQEIKISSRARPSGPLTPFPLVGLKPLKSQKNDKFGTKILCCPNVTITYYLLHFSYVSGQPKPSKYRHCGTSKPCNLTSTVPRPPKIQMASSKGPGEGCQAGS